MASHVAPLFSAALLVISTAFPARTLAEAPPLPRAHLVTLSPAPIHLSQALQEVATQTHIRVQDRRRDRHQDPVLHVDVHAQPFWEALDAVARAANLNVSLYQPRADIALVDGPHRDVPTSYSGLFRIQIGALELNRDFQTGDRICRVRLIVAWEPTFRPLFLESGIVPVSARDSDGQTLRPIGQGVGRQSVGRERIFTEISMLTTAPARTARNLIQLHGELGMIGPSRTVRFTFNDLSAAHGSGKEKTQTADGVTVTLRRFEIEKGTPPNWNVGFLLQYPSTGPEFDSFESWLVTAQLKLVSKRPAADVSLSPTGYSDDTFPGHRAAFDYTFSPTGRKKLGQPADWKLVYDVPGPMVKMPVSFDFRNVPLP